MLRALLLMQKLAELTFAAMKDAHTKSVQVRILHNLDIPLQGLRIPCQYSNGVD